MPVKQTGRYAGRWYNDPEVSDAAGLASSARTVSGQSAAFAVEDAMALEATLAITAISGAGATVVLEIQTSEDGATNWDSAPGGLWPGKTATGTHKKVAGPLAKFARYVWTITGTTPSITFGVTSRARITG